ncbi:MAG TPA: dienelactone hydrolase family protein [Iamia sp.]|nr:dienelactone hydrolase family protein [Iamia sp.]
MLHRSRRARPLVALGVALALVGGACSSDGGDDDDDAGDASSTASSTTAAEETTTAPEDDGPALADLAERGPHGVGSIDLDLDGRRVVVWYPAADAGAGIDEPTGTFDIASLLSPELQAQVPAEMRIQYPVAAAPGAAPATDDGPYPLVLFSHGFAGFPEQSVSLTTHLASWGYVVAAPDHVERSLGGILGTAAQGVTPSTDPEVLTATADLVALTADDPSSPLDGMVDLERVAVLGHSAGAGAAYRTAATDPRIDAVGAYSLGAGGDEDLGEAPTVPALVMLGEADETIPADATREVFATMGTPRSLVEIAGAGHLVFSDLCLIGAEQGGLVGIVESIGLPIPVNLLQLASDGCGDAYPPVEDAYPAIDAVTVAFLGATFGDDALGALLDDGPVPVGEGATLTVEG